MDKRREDQKVLNMSGNQIYDKTIFYRLDNKIFEKTRKIVFVFLKSLVLHLFIIFV